MMKRAFLPPILVVALASMLLVTPPTKAAEPLIVFTPPPIELNSSVDAVLRASLPTAVFSGRTKDGMGYVLTSDKRGYFLRPQPGGITRIIPADPKAVRDLVKLSGWTL